MIEVEVLEDPAAVSIAAAAVATSAAHPDEHGITRRRIPRTVADADFKRPI
mgnify:CR=1 FL=1